MTSFEPTGQDNDAKADTPENGGEPGGKVDFRNWLDNVGLVNISEDLFALSDAQVSVDPRDLLRFLKVCEACVVKV